MAREMMLGAFLVAAAISPTAAFAAGDSARGESLYADRCAVCHGASGDGRGPVARYLEPRPRDFTTGTYKLRSTPAGSPPTSDDLYRTITQGMPGTAMPGWSEMPSQERWDLVSYLESLSPRFAGAPASVVTVPEPPPVTSERVARGQQLYQQFGCMSCHGVDGQGDGPAAAAIRDNSGRPVLPADFTRRDMLMSGGEAEGIFRVIVTGVDGTPMMSYRAALSTDEDVWSLAYFVRSLGEN